MRFPTAPSTEAQNAAPATVPTLGKRPGRRQASIVIGTHAGLPIRKIHRLGSTKSTDPRSVRQDSTDNRTGVKLSA